MAGKIEIEIKINHDGEVNRYVVWTPSPRSQLFVNNTGPGICLRTLS